VLAADAVIEALWQRDAPNGPGVCSLSGKIAGAVEFPCIITLGPNEFDAQVSRMTVKEVAGHDTYRDASTFKYTRTQGDG
jgi:hypothetical protein